MLIQEDYFKNIFNTVREGILILDENMRVLSANRSFFNIFKVDFANTIGSLLYDLGNGQWNIPNLRVLLEDILPKNDTVDDYEIEHNFEGIGHKTMLLNACKIREKKNDLPIILLAIEDITERRKLEEAHRKLAAIVEFADDAIIGEDLEGIIVSWNRGAEIAYGYNAKEIVGKSISSLMPPSHPDEYKEVLAQIARGETIKHYETQRRRKDGPIIDVSLTISPVKDASGEIISASTIARDITERKEIEAGLEKTRKELVIIKKTADEVSEFAESVINTVREPLTSLDQDLRVVTVSRSFYEFFKVKPEETVGQLIYDLGNKQWNIPKLRELLETILPQKTSFDNYEVEHNFATIGRRIMLLNARQIKRVSGKERIILLAIEDITERKRLESLLEESEVRYRRVFETASDAILLLEKREGEITHANPAAEKMLGYSMKECIGKKLQNIGVELDVSDFQTIMQTLNRSGIINYVDVPVRTKSGQHIDTDIYMVDRAMLAQCNIRDVTERKTTEKHLQSLNRTLLAHSKSSKAMMSASNETWYLNEVCRTIVEDCGHALVWIGFAEQDEGRTVRPVAQAGVEEGYVDTMHITWSDTERGRGPVGTAIRTGKPSVVRDILVGPAFAPWREEAVKRGYAAIIAIPLLAEGKAFGSLNIYSRHQDPFSEDEVQLLNDLASDLSYGIAAIRLRTAQEKSESALRKKEKDYRTLLENLPQKIFHKDKNSVYISCNKNYADDLGIKPNEIVGKTDYEFFPKDLAEKYNADDKKLMELGKTEDIDEKYIQSGQDKWVHTVKAPVRDDSGNITGILGLSWDISEHRKLEDQLRHAQKMEAIGTLAGGIAHDFNNILNVIMGYGGMVLKSLEADSPSKARMNEVLAATERAAVLTKRLLVFSRKQVVEVKPINVNETIIGIQKMLAQIIRESIDMKLDLADTRLIVMADAGQIEQVLMNLVTNAKDAMLEGGQLMIGTGLQEVNDEYVAAYGYGKPGKYALITVADTGHGIDAETQKHIFEPFFTTKGIGQGTGLGLAISYGIIKQHNGYIKVYSEPGEGTVFKIYLPLIEEVALADKKLEAPDAVKGGNETILVAEDDTSLRKLSRIVLESFGYSVITAEDGEGAIAKYMENRDKIQLIILDMIMPKKNGKEVSEALRKVSPGIKILFVSGYTMDIIKNKELTEAGFDFIHKPVMSQDLLRKVREVLDK